MGDESLLNAWFRATGYEKFRLRGFRHELSKDRQDRLAGSSSKASMVIMVEMPDSLIGRTIVAQGVIDDSWIRLCQRNKMRSKFGVLARELDGEGRKDDLEVAPALKTEGATKLLICECPFCNRLCGGCFPCSGQPVQRFLRESLQALLPDCPVSK